MFNRAFKEEMATEQADDEDSMFERQKQRQKFLAHSLQMEVRTRDQVKQEEKKVPRLNLGRSPLRSPEEQFLSLDHFLKNQPDLETKQLL